MNNSMMIVNNVGPVKNMNLKTNPSGPICNKNKAYIDLQNPKLKMPEKGVCTRQPSL
jgi:hypothetical protein